MPQFVFSELFLVANGTVFPAFQSYYLRFPQASQVATALHRTNCLRYTLSVVDSSNLPWKDYSRFWSTIFDSEQDLWLWEDEDECELEHQFTRASEESENADQDSYNRFRGARGDVDESDDFIARKLQECSKRVDGTERLAHLESTTRIQFLTWLFIVAIRFVDDAVVELRDTIVDWMRFFDYPTVSHGAGCYCDPGAIKEWVNVMLQVYSVADLRLMPRGSSCNCLDAELALRPIEAETDNAEAHPGRCRWLFQMLMPVTWPRILWVLFRMLRPNEPKPVLVFLSLLREKQHRDLLAWDRRDRDVLSGSQQQFKMTPLILDWHRYVPEIDSQTWVLISCLTRVEDRSFACRDPILRIRAFTLLLCMSLNIPQPIAEALDIGISSEYWIQFADIASPASAKEPQLLSRRTRPDQYWSASHLKTSLQMEAHGRCFDILNVSKYTMLERVQLISFILNNHETFQPLFAFYPATRCNLSLPLSYWTVSERLSRYLKENQSCTVLSFRASFNELLSCLKFNHDFAAMYDKDKHTIGTHVWATDLYSHVVECLIYLTARLVKCLQTRDGYDTFLKHRGTEAQETLDLIQDLLDMESLSIIRPMLFKGMCRLARASNLYPRCFTLTGLHKVGTQVAGGGYGDIWKGLVRGQSVCVKMLRIFQDSDIAMAVKEFGKEALIWRQLCHPNVLPFFGLYYIENRLCLISPWMENGHIMEFLRANSPDMQKRFSMILDVSSGLEYLHNQNTIHGDLKGINILVTPSGRACIADFGLSIIVNAMTLRLTTSTTVNHKGTARYNAPELFEEGAKTFASDIYAFGCVAYEILTGELPFRKYNDIQIMFRVFKGERPERLPSCAGTPALDSFWELLEMCWDGEKEKRPNTDKIIERLIQSPITAATTPMQYDWDDQFTAKFRRSINMQPLLPSVREIERMIFGEEVAKGMKVNTTSKCRLIVCDV
ncbi:kinase domain-containing protein [Favolaschia claudopus]|uniref:Kinase domain-containing protein n=1 Tax=Favolaschia claudopus TaxID=2862362 RepID=A0AAW0A7Y8_9AGAR